MRKRSTASEDMSDELLALARMVSYACQHSRALELDFSTYCLEIALTSLVEDLAKLGVQIPSSENFHAPSGEHKGLH